MVSITQDELHLDKKELEQQLAEALVLLEKARANANAISGAIQFIERKLNSSIGATDASVIQ